MKLDSKYFDKIRVKPGEERTVRDKHPNCEWPGCPKPGRHKAPKGRNHEGQFHAFCLEHVQQYNKTYNYFDGMKDDAVRDYQKEAQTGHRPTWKLGQNSSTMNSSGRRARPGSFRDPFNLLGEGDASWEYGGALGIGAELAGFGLFAEAAYLPEKHGDETFWFIEGRAGLMISFD